MYSLYAIGVLVWFIYGFMLEDFALMFWNGAASIFACSILAMKIVYDRQRDPILSASSGAEYTCPMHPQIRQRGPGNCPICGMTLEPVSANVESEPEFGFRIGNVTPSAHLGPQSASSGDCARAALCHLSGLDVDVRHPQSTAIFFLVGPTDCFVTRLPMLQPLREQPELGLFGGILAFAAHYAPPSPLTTRVRAPISFQGSRTSCQELENALQRFAGQQWNSHGDENGE